MKKTHHIAAILCMLTCAQTARANDGTQLPLNNYIDLTYALQARGVNPIHVGWNEVEMLCLGLRDRAGAVPYNQCRLEKATLQAAYRGDRGACNAASRATYPTRLRATQVGYVIGGNGVSTLATPGIGAGDYRAGRTASYDACMASKGWRSSGNWQLGLRE